MYKELDVLRIKLPIPKNDMPWFVVSVDREKVIAQRHDSFSCRVFHKKDVEPWLKEELPQNTQ
jgi:hypothetical protein